MAPPPIVHLLCYEEVANLLDLEAETFLERLVLYAGAETEMQDVTVAQWRAAWTSFLPDVWNGTVELDEEYWVSHAFNPWPLPPYPEGL